jgi:formate hydrogenlyase subunit 6/NADH:ubiquinone oxidoreductase subunit I
MSGIPTKYPGLNPIPPDFSSEHPPLAEVVEEQCIACDRCPPICFFDAIVMEPRAEHKYRRTAVIIEENCTGCGLCFEACPVDAIIWVPDIAPTTEKPPPVHIPEEEDRDL